jgi:hypothetical protein
MRRVYIAIPVPARELWRLLADPEDCPPGYMIVGTMAAVRRRRLMPVQTSANAVLALPAASSEPNKRTLCVACPLRQAPAVAQEVRSA